MATVVAATVKKGGVETDVALQTALADSTTLATLLGTDGVAVVVDPAKIKGSLEFARLNEMLEMVIEARANLPTDI